LRCAAAHRTGASTSLRTPLCGEPLELTGVYEQIGVQEEAVAVGGP